MSQTFGRRPVAILSSLVCLASMIWRAKATTYNSFMGACVLNGLGAGPSEVRNIHDECLPSITDHYLVTPASGDRGHSIPS